MIVVRYVDEYIWVDKDGGYNVQVCGYKDRTPMMLEVWRIPSKTEADANDLRERIAKNKMIFTDQALPTLPERR